MAEVSLHSRGAGLRPLAHVRVLEVGSSISAAFAAKLLGDLGAEVIKVEHPKGDPLRRQGPFMLGDGVEQLSALFGYLNHGKRCVGIDLGTVDGREAITGLLACATLLLWDSDDPTTGMMRTLADAKRLDRPATVVFSPYGLVGARAGRAGSAFVAQHSGGLAYHQAYPVGDPEKTPPAGAADREADMIVGLVAANAALWALFAPATRVQSPLSTWRLKILLRICSSMHSLT